MVITDWKNWMGTSADALSGMTAPPGAGNVPMDPEVSRDAVSVEWDGFVTSVDDVPVSVPVSCVTVVTPSGNANQFCHGTTENPTGGVVKFSGESTGRICVPEFPTGGGTPSLKWSEVITPSGQVSFTC